jgi:CubicO group peptidase (beta-lactamase class C family)
MAEAEFIKSLDDFRGKIKAPALAVGILSAEGSSFYVRGVRKLDCPIPATRVDRFRIAGLGQIVIPTLLAILIEQGIFHWSTTIVEALPEVADRIHADHRKTTLEMLCARVSGIETTYRNFHESRKRASAKQMSSTESRETLAMELLALPGMTSSFTKANLYILMFILEKRTSRSIEDLLKAELFDPLEMYHTGWYVDQDRTVVALNMPTQPRPHQISKNTDKLMHFDVQGVPEVVAAFWPLDGLSSTMPDVMVFLDLHIHGVLGLASSLLTATSFQRLHTLFHGTDRTPGGWKENKNDLYANFASFGWSHSMLIDRDKKEAYVSLVNVGLRHGPLNTYFSELKRLCQQRPPNLLFQNRTI